MKTKFFSRSNSLIRSSLNTADLEQEMNTWLAAHPDIKVVEIKHSAVGNIWSYAQLVVTIYYTDALS